MSTTVAWPTCPPPVAAPPLVSAEVAARAAVRAQPEIVTGWQPAQAPAVRPGWHRHVRAVIVAVLVVAAFAVALASTRPAPTAAPPLPDCPKTATLAGWAVVHPPNGGCTLRP